MLLQDSALLSAMANGSIHVYPFREEALQPSSIDLTLDNKLRVFSNIPGLIDLKEDNSEIMDLIEVGLDDFYDLQPGEFILASTVEAVSLNNEHAARVEGKSSLGRLGLLVHATAGFVDPGFYGTITLELSNLTRSPMRLYPGMPIAQFCVFQMAGPCKRPYDQGGKYSGQSGPTASQFHRNFLKM
jgi:dCTP deaminase